MTITPSPTPSEVFAQLMDHSNRANPYPLYAQLRHPPVQRLDDGTYLITGYEEILSVGHDPRISSNPIAYAAEQRGCPAHTRTGGGTDADTEAPSLTSAFVMQDPPVHDRLRRQTMRHFGPPHRPDYIDGMRGHIEQIANELIDGFADRTEIDIVADFAYPLPVRMICDVLGVPPEDEPKFHAWSEAMITPPEGSGDEHSGDGHGGGGDATAQMAAYLAGLVEQRRGHPSSDLLSGLVNDHGPDGAMSSTEVLNTAIMLLIGGHETTVNRIANGVLTLLRNPGVLERMKREPELIGSIFEELLRVEPPAQITPTRIALADVEVGGVVIPKGAPIWMVWAAANRDPRRFADPDRFNPDRDESHHLGFGTGVHSCFGAPLARLETQIALTVIFERLVHPRLVADPPPYRRNALLRGPSSLVVAVDSVVPAGATTAE